MIKTGFYNISSLSKVKLKAFFKEAVMLSYDTHIDILDCNKSWTRQHTSDTTIKHMINNCSPSYHNVCIDRSIQNESFKEGEIGYTIISGKYFLYIYVTLDNLKILVNKYKLEMK